MRIDASSILSCLLVIAFKMKSTTAESGPALVVTYIPDRSSLQIPKYSYCRFQILESGVPTTTIRCTYFDISVYFLGVVADYQSDVLFLYENIRSIIYMETNHSQEAIRTWIPIQEGLAGMHTRIAYDWLSKNLYWTDITYGWIGVISPRTDDQRRYRILVHENIQRPHGIALDPIQGFLFWTDIDQTVRIERSSLSGDDRRVLISSGLITPYSIVADIRTQNMFWIDDEKDTIESAQYDGTGRKIIKRIAHAGLFHLEVFKELVYVSDPTNKQFYVINKNTGETQIALTLPYHYPYGITMYHPDVQAANITDYCRLRQCSQICISKKAGAMCMCKEGFILSPDGKNCSEDSGPFHRGLVVSNSTSLCIADIHAISTSGFNLTCFLLVAGITHFELDTIRREIIFANNSGLYYTSFDQFTVQNLIAVSGNVSGLAFDWKDRSIYWTEVNTGKILLVSRDRSISLTILSSLASPRNILVLPIERLMFWVSGSHLYKIESSKLDGTDRRVVTYFSATTSPASISFDPSSQRLYFVDDSYIKTCNLNGSDVQKISTAPSNTESIYIYKAYLLLHYRSWPSLSSTIKSFVIEGLNLTEKSPSQFTSIGSITDMKVFDERVQPSGKGPCDEMNGGCEQICIATGLVNRVCRCQLGFKTDPANANGCSSSPVYNNFLLVSDWTNDMIYQLSLETNDVQAVDVKKIKDPTGVAYDYIRKTVIWGSSNLQQILSVNINASIEMLLFPTGDRYNTFPDRFAIDFATGNIFYTAVSLNGSASGGYIAVLSLSGRHKKLITELEQPRAIVLYPSKGLMFWTDHGTYPYIGKSAMNGQNKIAFINTGVTWPNGLALDYKNDRLYWTDGSTNRVESCKLDGTERTIVFVDSEAHLMDIAYDNAGYLYYTAWNRPYITKLVLSQTIQAVHLFENAELGRLDDLDIYLLDNQPPPNILCSYNNGNCSTFCFPTMDGRSCSCEDLDSISADGVTCSSETTTYRSTASSTTVKTKSTMVLPTTPSSPTQDSSTTKTTKTTARLPTTENVTSSTRVADPLTPEPTGDNNQKLIPIVAGSAGGIVVLIAIVATIFITRCMILRKTHKQGGREQSMSWNRDIEIQPRRNEPSEVADRSISVVSDDYDTIQPNEVYSCPDYLTPRIYSDEFREQTAGNELEYNRVGNPDYETLTKSKELAYSQTAGVHKGRVNDYESPDRRLENEYTHLMKIAKLPVRGENRFGEETKSVGSEHMPMGQVVEQDS
ncbi:hypothetical protein CHS0354_000353 [Potamilus streckersoni]|uniref:EGF-like domain-containing protein n=1 Tax=Potamilus streckersoni TaxID=2493646 RepID=A0AAE0W7P3_9BIVA|nr:hypothetical protein CHS0354_000353 [Potamilus streckersoni]